MTQTAMTFNTKSTIAKQVRSRKYLNKDYSSFKSDILEYARTYFPNANEDFSEAGIGGLFLDMASVIGDNQSFYLDHQFHELDPNTAVESVNIERHLRNAGVPIVGASPSVVSCMFFVEVPATSTAPILPDTTALPIIQASTICKSDNGTMFELVESVDFTETDEDGNLVANISIGSRNAQNTPTTFIVSKSGLCISGFRATESFSVGSFTPFMKFALSRENITEIISVSDSENNTYYEVEHLTQDTVFKAVPNKNSDNQMVQDALVLLPAPYRFTKAVALSSRLTTLTFGGGSASSLDNDIIPDPSEFAVPLYGKRSFSRFSIDPGNLLQTQTLGTIAPNTTVSIVYRHGGGLSHNVIARSIRDITSLLISFPNNPTPRVAQAVRASISVINEKDAAGGEDPPTVEELKQKTASVRASQGRIVSKPDALARLYTMPSNFGRVFRAALHPNANNPLATKLYIISRNSSGQLVTSPDTLKENVARYLNAFRLVSDAIDILDASVINLKIQFSVVVDPAYTDNKNLVLQAIIKRLRVYFEQKKLDMDQPIVIGDIHNLIFNNPGVVSVSAVRVTNIFGTVGVTDAQRTYSTVQYDIDSNTDRGIVFGPPGSIFEVRYPEFDILGSAS